jgi:hypothetical protein
VRPAGVRTETGAELLRRFEECRTSDRLNAALRVAWPACNAPVSHLAVETWVALFRRAGFVTDGPPLPTEDVTIFRGAKHPWSEGRGLSFSFDQGWARVFATRGGYEGPVALYRAVASPLAVLGRFVGSTFEDEVVVDPDMIFPTSIKQMNAQKPPWQL